MHRTRSVALAAAAAAALSVLVAPGAPLDAQAKKPAGAARGRRLHGEDQGAHHRPAVHHRAGRSPAGVGHRAVAARSSSAASPARPDELTYSKDVYRYFDALDAASDRVKVFRIGKTEEGREMITVVVADEATIKSLDKWKGDHRDS